MLTTISLPDVSVWLALSAAHHPHRQAAKAWLDTQPEGSAAFFRITYLGLLRLLTSRSVILRNGLTVLEGFAIDRTLRTDRRILFTPEPPEIEATVERLMRMLGTGASSWTDAYLGAFCQQAGLTLVTFDRGFQRGAELRLDLLTGA